MRRLLALFLAGVATAQVTIKPEPGMHGQVRSRRWSFVSVLVENGGKDTTGELQFTLKGDDFPYVRRVDLPAGSHKRFNLYFRFRDLQTEGTVRFVAANGEEVKKPITFPAGNRDPYYLAAVWSKTITLQDLGLGAFVPFQSYRTDELPDHWKGWDAFDVLVIDSPEVLSILPAQAQALRDWVEAGGHVVIVGDPTWTPAAIDPVLKELLPLHDFGGAVEGVSAFPVQGLTKDKAISVLKLVPKSDAFLRYGTAKGPLWVREIRGSGIVDFIPFHPRQISDVWDHNGQYFWGLGLYGRNQLPKNPDPREEREHNVPLLVAPEQATNASEKFGWVTLFAFVYAVLAGPGVFWVQRRYRNVFTRALTFPAIVVGFVVLAWMLNFILRDRVLASRRINLVYTTQDGKFARGMTYFSFLSPNEGNFQFASQRPGSVFTVLPRGGDEAGIRASDMRVEEGATHRINSAIRPWVDVAMLSEWKGEAEPGIVSHLSMPPGTEWKDATLTGDIENTADTPIEDCRLVWNGQVYGPFKVAPKSHSARIILPGSGETLRAHWERYFKENPFVLDDAKAWHVGTIRDGYSFLALLGPGSVPFPKPPPNPNNPWGGASHPMEDKEFDSVLFSVMPQVDAHAAILLGWRAEDASKIDVAGHELSPESLTMYAVRLWVR